jgi:hypothetical protein
LQRKEVGKNKDTSLSYNEAKTAVKAAPGTKWRNSHPEYDQNNNIYRLTRREQVIIFRLRTHCRLQHHLNYEFRIGESDMCPCNTQPMTVDNVLT